MKNGFEIKDDGSMPIVHVNGKQMSIVSLFYKWETKTDNPSDGANICIVEGFFEDDHNLRRVVFDMSNKKEIEKELQDGGKNTRFSR
jgi:hypothetical protein